MQQFCCVRNRDKKVLVEYVATVEKVLRRSESGSTAWSTDELIPAELGAKRQSSSLVAVRTLVKTFVLTHNRIINQLASAHCHGNQLQQQEVDRLQLELRRLISPLEVGFITRSVL